MKKIIVALFLTVTLLTGCQLDEETVHETTTTAAKNEQSESTRLDEVKVHFINVGQGDSTLIEYRDYHILIDAGNNWYGDDVVDYLKNQGVDDIELLIGTHPDADHIGGLDVVLEHFEVEQVVDSCKDHTTQTWFDYYTAIKNESTAGNKRVCDDHFEYVLDDGIVFQIIETGDDYTDQNENSVLSKLSINEIDILLTADIEERIEELILDYNIEAEILKVGHHGSNTSSSEAFLEVVDPEVAIISAGEDNRYGHPHTEVLQRLDKYTDLIFGTWKSGHIIVTVKDDEYSINTNQTIGYDHLHEGDHTDNTSTQLDVTLLQLSETVARGNTAEITIQGIPNEYYDIDVIYSSGVSSASGLENKRTDEDGIVTWQWTVGSRVRPGTYEIVLKKEGQLIRYEFDVVE